MARIHGNMRSLSLNTIHIRMSVFAIVLTLQSNNDINLKWYFIDDSITGGNILESLEKIGASSTQCSLNFVAKTQGND